VLTSQLLSFRIWRMTQSKIFKGDRCQLQIIQYVMCLCHRSNLRHRDIEDLLSKEIFPLAALDVVAIGMSR
jgi:hypothetical protein